MTAHRPNNLKALRDSGWQSKSVKHELRDNYLAALKTGETLFPGIVGYDDTVIPEISIAVLAGHDMLFLGEKGQAKSRLMRSLVRFLDEYVPYLDIPGAAVHEDPYAPITRAGKELVEEPDQRAHQSALSLPLLAEEQHVVAREDRDRDFRDHGVVVSDDPGEERLASLECGEVVIAEFVLDRLRLPAGVAERLEVVRPVRGHDCPCCGSKHRQHSRPVAGCETNLHFGAAATTPDLFATRADRKMPPSHHHHGVKSMRFGGLLCVLVALSSVARVAADESVPNPEFDNWSRFKKGTSVTLKSSSEVMGTTSEVLVTTTLVEVGPDKLVVAMTSVAKANGIEFKSPPAKRDVSKTITLPKGAKKEEFVAGKPTGTMEEGEEAVKVAGGVVKAKWYKYVIEMDKTKTEARMWMSDDVPGRVAKCEMTTSGMFASKTKMEVVEVKKQ